MEVDKTNRSGDSRDKGRSIGGMKRVKKIQSGNLKPSTGLGRLMKGPCSQALGQPVLFRENLPKGKRKRGRLTLNMK